MQSPCDPFLGFAPGQEPEVMPGFLAPTTQRQEGAQSPEASPWPPLSRKQVVELHEALSRWLRAIQSADNATDWASHVWSANDALRTCLLDMGIQPIEEPTPATKWAMLEAVLAVLAEREAKASLASSPLGVVKHNCWTCKHSRPERGGLLCWATTADALPWLNGVVNSIGIRGDGQMMLEQTADGCPGWEPKP